MDIGTGIALLFFLLVAYFYLKSNTKRLLGPPRLRAPQTPKTFSLTQLHEFDKSSATRYIAVCGKVYDVSASENYAAGGGYDSFTGHDATLALARMSLDPSLLDKPMENDARLLKAATDWAARFDEKYPVVGLLEVSKTAE